MSDMNIPGEADGIMGDEVPAGDEHLTDEDDEGEGDLDLGAAIAPPD